MSTATYRLELGIVGRCLVEQRVRRLPFSRPRVDRRQVPERADSFLHPRFSRT